MEIIKAYHSKLFYERILRNKLLKNKLEKIINESNNEKSFLKILLTKTITIQKF